jgi:glycine cleavage system regulatory protein
MAHLTFEVAIILIFKHTATLCFSGVSANLALTQAELDYHKADVASKIKGHFTAPYKEYSIEQFTSFLMDTNIGLSSLASTRSTADSTVLEPSE